MDEEFLIAALTAPPADRAATLARLPAGRLWQAFLPGMDPVLALAAMGAEAAAILGPAVTNLPSADEAFAIAGIPFAWDDAFSAITATALLADGRALSRRREPSSGAVSVTVDLPPRAEWVDRIHACLRHTAEEFSAGTIPDNLDALVMAPSVELRPALGFVDYDTRLRFAAGLSRCGMDPNKFARTYLHRSAASGMLLAIRRSLEDCLGAAVGRDETGWPVWFDASGDDPEDALARLPEWIARGYGHFGMAGIRS